MAICQSIMTRSSIVENNYEMTYLLLDYSLNATADGC